MPGRSWRTQDGGNRAQVWGRWKVRSYPHLGSKSENPRTGTHCHHLHCPHHCLGSLCEDRSIRLAQAQALYPQASKNLPWLPKLASSQGPGSEEPSSSLVGRGPENFFFVS